MWEYWFEAIVIFMLLGISGRLYKMGRELSDFHDCFHHFEEQLMNPQDEVHVDDGKRLRVMGLEDFMDEFGFDPRQPPEEVFQDNRKEIEAWDNE
tara:strand:+ start:9896 stop:10180 length:285 start_codon:yes stop_codon:yes gene_type:complete